MEERVKVIFEPDQNFENEFSEFIEELLNSEEKNGELHQNTQRNTGGTCQNEVE